MERWAFENRAFDTFLRPHLSDLDLYILYHTCTTFRKLIRFVQSPRRYYVEIAINSSYPGLTNYLKPASVDWFEFRECIGNLLNNIKHHELPLVEDIITKFLQSGKWTTVNNWTAKTYKNAIAVAAINAGYLEILKLLKKMECLQDTPSRCPANFDITFGFLAAKNNNRDIILWLIDIGYLQWNDETFCCGAAAAGNMELLRWLHERNAVWKSTTICYAIKGGHFEIMKWAYESGCPIDQSCCAVAAFEGNLPYLKWLREHNCNWSSYTAFMAAKGGHLELLQWAHQHGIPRDHWVCAEAAENGHFELLKWAHANGFPMENNVCSIAAEKNDMNMLMWARSVGCPWSSSATWYAAAAGHFELLKSIRILGCPWDKSEILLQLKSRYPKSIDIQNWVEMH